MQPLARDGLTAAQVRALLTAASVRVSAGLELLDTSNALVADISDDLQGGSVSWDNRDAVHGSCRLSLTRTLAWGRDRVRPYMTLADDVTGNSARFNLGVYVLTTPDERRGEDPITYEVTGYDLLSLLQTTGPADTYEVVAGTTYIQAARDVVTASGIGAPLLIDGTLQDTAIPATMVWALTNPPASWLRILTELLGAINYTPPWIDENGAIRSRPFVDPAQRPPEWTLDTSDASTDIAGEDRTISTETGDIANSWRFIRSNMDVQPTEGDGIYTPAKNQSDGPTSIDALGREIPKVVWLDAADQATLVAQGDRIVTQDKASARTVRLTIDPLPVMGQDDVFLFIDGTAEKMAAASWTVNLDGSRGPLQLGGAPPEPVEPAETQAKATVTQAAELRVVIDGATVDSMANALDAATYAAGQRVTVTVRNPRPPLVQGQET